MSLVIKKNMECSVCGKNYKSAYTLAVHKHRNNHFVVNEGRARGGMLALLLARWFIKHRELNI